jgi:hypothetical protein
MSFSIRPISGGTGYEMVNQVIFLNTELNRYQERRSGFMVVVIGLS